MESILYRLEIGRKLTWEEVDNNFKYVSNPWNPDRPYLTGMIIYHDIIPDNYIFYRANTTTTTDTFILSEWDAISNAIVYVTKSVYDNINDYILNEWDNSIKIGDYVVTIDNKVYLLYQNDGDSSSDYIYLNQLSGNKIGVIVSSQTTLIDFIVNEWTSDITIGDIVILNSFLVYMLTAGDGTLVSHYILLSNSIINWTDIIGRPTSSSSQIDTSVLLSHAQNTDIYLNYGGANQVSASTIVSHINDTSIHFTMADIHLSHLDLTDIGIYSHLQIDSHILDSTIHFTQSQIDHDNILNRGTLSHANIDAHIIGTGYSHSQIDTFIDTLSSDISGHIGTTTIHFLETDIQHANIHGVGSYDHSQIDSHINDTSIHHDLSTIDHTLLLNIGSYSHNNIDPHIIDTTIHYTQSSIDHENLIGAGFYMHYQIDSHIDDTSIHYLQTEIDHEYILNNGTYAHDYIDNFIDNIATVIETTIPLRKGNGVNSVMMLNSNGVSGNNSIAFGSSNINNSSNSAIIGGSGNTLALGAANSLILGGTNINGLLSDTVYAVNLNAVNSTTIGNTKIVNWSGETTDNSQTELFLLDLNRYLITNSTSVVFSLDINAYNSFDNVGKFWQVRGAIKRSSTGTVQLIGTVSYFIITEDGVYDTGFATDNWDISVNLDNVNKSLKVEATGEVTKTIKWNITGILTINI